MMMGTINCTYETPCGWCVKWDKKCDRKIGAYTTKIVEDLKRLSNNSNDKEEVF